MMARSISSSAAAALRIVHWRKVAAAAEGSASDEAESSADHRKLAGQATFLRSEENRRADERDHQGVVFTITCFSSV
jgi:hypothetical protein